MLLVWLGLGIGIVIGAAAMTINFCALGAVADILFAKDWRRMRAWILAAGTALLVTQGLIVARLITLTDTPYLAPVSLIALVIGGLAFGYGMALSGGCINRALVRTGAGSFKSLVVLLSVAIAAAATNYGTLALFASHQTLAPNLAVFGSLTDLMHTLVPNHLFVHGLMGLIFGGGMMIFALKDQWFRENTTHVLGSILIGAMVPLSWLLTSRLGIIPQAINFAQPAGQTLFLLTGGSALGFAESLFIGVPVGSFLVAAATRNLAFETFTDRQELPRNLVGGVLMGCGGTLSLGCTFGQGFSGLSALAMSSLIAIGAILFGCLWGIRSFEAESVWGGLKLALRRR